MILRSLAGDRCPESRTAGSARATRKKKNHDSVLQLKRKRSLQFIYSRFLIGHGGDSVTFKRGYKTVAKQAIPEQTHYR